MAENIDHDRLFKELLSTFFIEFIELFFPEVINYLEPNSVTLIDKETFTDVTAGEKYETDLIAQVRFRGEPSYFLIHLEAESGSRPKFNKRMFRYFARLHEKFDLPIYPIVIFSYSSPKKLAISNYQIDFPDFEVLRFNYRVVQLNQLNWRDFLRFPNPVASALMSKMDIAPLERPKVKAECLRLLVTLKLNPAKMQLISGFIDTYLKLNLVEEQEFQTELGLFRQEEQEEVMQIVTSWMRQGIEQGIEREKDLVVRQIKRKLGGIDAELEAQIRELDVERLEVLGEAFLDFSTVETLRDWLDTVNN
ncbi:Putative transposase, YhgA [Cylindrospermum stagnale PCC 7417]|uniref:Putative transposase, YhgA n=1 Tax=Cylindrospermum stagnale PCC 7417 TaxID=56107 RepID=K9X4P4_9NOST|nr:DUF4351 domain-containing protein [Cylindrospermum stagnale]AFZ27036.1 Putative transposase, YhgA [Cylindrospermum stagnale PCC 7417]